MGNRYRLGRKIGSGSFGDIYLGEAPLPPARATPNRRPPAPVPFRPPPRRPRPRRLEPQARPSSPLAVSRVPAGSDLPTPQAGTLGLFDQRPSTPPPHSEGTCLT